MTTYQERNVILLTRDNCHICDLAREYMNERQVDHIELNADKVGKIDKPQVERYTLPALLVWGEPFEGFDEIKKGIDYKCL